jgi:hypothetical protein
MALVCSYKRVPVIAVDRLSPIGTQFHAQTLFSLGALIDESQQGIQ